MSWDEPLFYGYADSIGYAYSLHARQSNTFDLANAFGPSPGDHGNRGPAYIILARQLVYIIQDIASLDSASAWHMVNFLFFQVGVIFFYLLSQRWMKTWGTIGATLLFSTQPLMWGHAFINPKDPSFMIAFLGSVCLGFRMVDQLNKRPGDKKKIKTLMAVLLPATLLGLSTSIRVIGPLAGVLVLIYALFTGNLRQLIWFLPYGLIAILVSLATWPYLWPDPIRNFVAVVGFMSENPTTLPVLFYGNIYPANELPIRYLPYLLLVTLTEPVWFLFLASIFVGIRRTLNKEIEWRSLLLVLAWFSMPVFYVLLRRPPMYDGYRHFLFIVPPIFLIAGLAFDYLSRRLKTPQAWINVLVLLAILLPGAVGLIQLHPYQYTYYNSFIGGTRGAFRNFETDYWLTCYKESMEKFNERYGDDYPFLAVKREAYAAAYYADDTITVKEYRTDKRNLQPGDFVLVASRSNEDLSTKHREPVVITVGRSGATFCFIKQISETESE
ncbi:MAG: hypothetical protein JXA13_13180 [Anaerolineales bacterium]|nr:hypothetical protein [Anaerolineales bacterium]